MDAYLFRGSQKLESMQIHAEIVASKTKDMIYAYSQNCKTLLLQIWNSEKFDHIRFNIAELIKYLIDASKEFKSKILTVADLKQFWIFLTAILKGKWTKRDATVACAGFVVGGLVGVAVGLAIRKREPISRYMQAIQISHYLGSEAIQVVEDAIAPYECGDYDVLINVKAASVQIMDAEICCGYGRNLRRILRRIYKQSSSDLPVILGRDCTGIVTDIGKKVKRLEIGDEVWVTVPFWSQGTLCQSLLVSENRVARKPRNVGFEGACSIPYAGSLALSVLNEANIDFSGAQHKRFLILAGCTPVGCVLIQLLKNWHAHITTTCNKRAMPVAQALGANEIISIEDIITKEVEHDEHECGTGTLNNNKRILIKQLEARGEQYDVIVLTRNEGLDLNELSSFCTTNGQVLSTFPKLLASDSCGLMGRLFLEGYIKLKFLFLRALNSPPDDDYDESHLCHATLDKLAEFVEDSVLQTVVDKVFSPKDIELAINHIQSTQSIGSSVVTFR